MQAGYDDALVGLHRVVEGIWEWLRPRPPDILNNATLPLCRRMTPSRSFIAAPLWVIASPIKEQALRLKMSPEFRDHFSSSRANRIAAEPLTGRHGTLY